MEVDGMPAKLLRLIKVYYRSTRNRVRAYGEESETFEVKTGVRQGCALSPALFNYTIDYILGKALSGLRGSCGWMEYERRAEVVATFRVKKKPAEVMVWFGFKRSMVMDIWRKWKACENKDEFIAKQKAHNVRFSAVRTDKFVTAAKETVGNDGSQSYVKIAADMGCHKSTIYRKINKDNGYSSYCKYHRMLITNASSVHQTLSTGRVC
ncbi:unnamed protein product [Acanthosepion pharaonis]|uniref:Reverse transcriptase domain-containing protein n=1 Tax=Acanthosepion pharaonis TaxID=158019 RepID=A0A812BXA1_ACAPH|nr:unnamed protein product [Sepia pharaonis]